MLLTTAIGLFLGFWSLIYLVDYYFRVRSLQRYLTFVENTGLVITPFQLRLYTSKFQRLLDGWSFLKSPKVKKFLDLWFDVGVFAGVLALGFMLYLLTSTLTHQLVSTYSFGGVTTGTTDGNPSAIGDAKYNSAEGATAADSRDAGAAETQHASIVPVIPGVNLPWSQVPLLFVVLTVAGVVHELGHAVAAINENVTVNGFGVFVLGIYPGAFTVVEQNDLAVAPVFKRLKIYCAGIWHNLLTALWALICISALPHLLSIAYICRKGVVVTSVESESGLTISGGLKRGDVLYELNYCKVYDEDTWSACLEKLARKNYGYCAPRQHVIYGAATAAPPSVDSRMGGGNEVHCCDSNSTASHLCFYYKALQPSSSFGLNETSSSVKNNLNFFEYSCLPARYVTDHYICNYSLPCGPQAVCVYPALFNNTKLFRFQLANHSKPILFIGSPRAISAHVTTSGFVPRFTYAPLWLPPFLDLFLRYLFTFSLALGLLNAVPCYSLDGQFILSVVTVTDEQYTYGKRKQSPTRSSTSSIPPPASVIVNKRRRYMLYKILMIYGTFLLISVVAVGLVSFLKPLFLNG